jgi:cobaltochelatase CobS
MIEQYKYGQLDITFSGWRVRWGGEIYGWMDEQDFRNHNASKNPSASGIHVHGAYYDPDGNGRIDLKYDYDDKRCWRWDVNAGKWLTEKEFDEKYHLTPESKRGTIDEVVNEAIEERKEETMTVEQTPVKRGRGRPRKEVTEARKLETEVKDSLMELFLMGAREKITDAIQLSANEAVSDVVAYVDAVREEILQLEGRKLTLVTPLGKKVLTGARHEKFEQLLQTVSVGLAAMIVGPAGSGKTFASEQVAEALDLPFYAISVGSQTSKSDLVGFITANGGYVRTQFREAYENGGVFLMDEIDAGNANVLVLLNSALAGHSAAFPDQMVKKHENFRFVATANTFGTGANRQYVGRNQIDAATLDRFVTIVWPVDTVLEGSTVAHFENGSKWHKVIIEVRAQVDNNSWRLVVSPRATIKGAALLDAGVEFDEVVNMVLLGQADASQQGIIRQTAKSNWR